MFTQETKHPGPQDTWTLDEGLFHYRLVGSAPHWSVQARVDGVSGTLLILNPPLAVQAEIDRRKAEYATRH